MPATASLLVLTAPVKGAMRLAAVSPEALAVGLKPDMTLADARARLPDLDAVPARPDLDEAFLARLRDDFERFTPLLAIDPPHGLMLDITGCAHLSGGEVPMAARVRQRARAAGLHVHCALAGTPHAARAIARFAPAARDAPLIVPEGQDRAAIRSLSVAALELAPRDLTTLLRAGLKRLADVIDRDSDSLAARFGASFPARLARLTGAEDTRITPVRPPSPCMVERVLYEPVARQEHIEALLGELLQEAARELESAGLGGLRFEAMFYRTDGLKRCVTARVSRPTRDPAIIGMLLRERLGALDDPLDPGFGFDQIRLCVPATAALELAQTSLATDITPANLITDERQTRLGQLADRLTARLGPQAVLGMRPHGSHLPERAAQLLPAHLAGAEEAGWRTPSLEDPPMRPLHIFRTPQPVEAMAEAPDGYPLRFRWRRAMHDVAAAEGPERIAGEWWRESNPFQRKWKPLLRPEVRQNPKQQSRQNGAPAGHVEMRLNITSEPVDAGVSAAAAPGQPDRDYYRVEDREGRRFWLFRLGMYGAGTPPRWFIHGLFA